MDNDLYLSTKQTWDDLPDWEKNRYIDPDGKNPAQLAEEDFHREISYNFAEATSSNLQSNEKTWNWLHRGNIILLVDSPLILGIVGFHYFNP